MKEFRSSVEKVYDKICSNIYTQLLLVEQVRPFKRIDADLMMEQSVVCGLLGYFEFLTPHRLAIIKSWQRPNGCYGEIENEEELNRKQGWKTMRKLLVGKELSGTFWAQSIKIKPRLNIRDSWRWLMIDSTIIHHHWQSRLRSNSSWQLIIIDRITRWDREIMSKYILHTILYTFPKVLIRRIYLTISIFFSKWSFPIFSRPWCLTQGWYCKEKLDACQSSWGQRVNQRELYQCSNSGW